MRKATCIYLSSIGNFVPKLSDAIQARYKDLAFNSQIHDIYSTRLNCTLIEYLFSMEKIRPLGVMISASRKNIYCIAVYRI